MVRKRAVKVDGVVTEEYVYDGDGNRIKKTDSSSERIYIYSGMNVLYEVNTTTQMHAVYVYGPTGRIAKKVSDIAEYYHTDHLGSTRLVTTENGAVTEEIQYEPFGEEINAPEERYTYNGKERDETGLYYYGARYYDPAIGRFISRDPVAGEKESPQSLNRYTYCLNNPLTYVDPTGTETRDPQEIVEDIFKRMQNVNPLALQEIQGWLDAGLISDFEALGMILTLLGYTIRDNKDGTYSVWIDDNSTVTMKVDNSIPHWGSTDSKGNISLNFGRSGNVADMALVILHEVSHAVLEGQSDDPTLNHRIIYYIEYSYLTALDNRVFEFSVGFEIHLMGEFLNRGTEGLRQVSFSKILEKWHRWWKGC